MRFPNGKRCYTISACNPPLTSLPSAKSYVLQMRPGKRLLVRVGKSGDRTWVDDDGLLVCCVQHVR